jgi:glutaredoxin-related protein
MRHGVNFKSAFLSFLYLALSSVGVSEPATPHTNKSVVRLDASRAAGKLSENPKWSFTNCESWDELAKQKVKTSISAKVRITPANWSSYETVHAEIASGIDRFKFDFPFSDNEAIFEQRGKVGYIGTPEVTTHGDSFTTTAIFHDDVTHMRLGKVLVFHTKTPIRKQKPNFKQFRSMVLAENGAAIEIETSYSENRLLSFKVLSACGNGFGLGKYVGQDSQTPAFSQSTLPSHYEKFDASLPTSPPHRRRKQEDEILAIDYFIGEIIRQSNFP